MGITSRTKKLEPNKTLKVKRMINIWNRPTETSLMSTYNRADLAFVRGEGVWLSDKKGKKYLDLASGIAVNSLGHSNPKLVKVLADQGSKLWHTSNLYNVPNQEKLASLLTRNAFTDNIPKHPKKIYDSALPKAL